jgi:CBS domain-containing protein
MLSQAALREAFEPGERLGAAGGRPGRSPVRPRDAGGSLLTALRRLGTRDVSHLPAVSADDRQRLEGVVTRQDLLAAYERALTAEGH